MSDHRTQTSDVDSAAGSTFPSPPHPPQPRRFSAQALVITAAVLVVAVAGVVAIMVSQGDDGQRLDTGADQTAATTAGTADEPGDTANEATEESIGDDPADDPGDAAALVDWAGTYEWVESVEGGPASDQTVVHLLVLDEPAGDDVTELTGTFTQNGFQTFTEATVVARPVDGGVAIELVTVEGLTALEPGDVAFTLSVDPATPLTIIGELIPLQLDQPASGVYFVPVDGTGTADETTAPVSPPAGYNRENGYAVVQFYDEGEGAFVAVDLATGRVATRFHTAYLEATWYSAIELSPAGDAIYVSQGWEDSWYACESSLPDLIRLDLLSGGEPETIGRGVEPRVSPDGTRLAYLTASDCVPDPQQPGNWVVTVLDTIVVRDLASGSERRHTVPGLVAAVSGGVDSWELDLRGLVWLGDDRLGVLGGDMLSADDLTPTGSQLPDLLSSETFGRVLGYDPATETVLVEANIYDDEANLQVVVSTVRIATGEVVGVRPVEQGLGGTASPSGLDRTGGFLIEIDGATLILPDGTRFDLPAEAISVDW